jgi:flagellar hook-associated protein 3 FlgL
MVTRVSTSGSYSAILSNLQAAQQRQAVANAQVSSEMKGTNLKDYAKDAEMLTAMRSVQSRLQVYEEQTTVIADKLATQDQALNQVADAAQSVRQAIAEALANDNAVSLMEEISAQFKNVVGGLNFRHAGKYLFSGGQVDTKPVTAQELTDLTAMGATVPGFFQNDEFKATAKLDDSNIVTTGLLAEDMGTDMMTAFTALQAFHEATPLNGGLTPAQRTFLETQLNIWSGLNADTTETAALNGQVASRVDKVKANVEDRAITIEGVLGDITKVDMSEAVSRLQQAQVSVQAAAQVFVALQQTSLLNLLK